MLRTAKRGGGVTGPIGRLIVMAVAGALVGLPARSEGTAGLLAREAEQSVPAKSGPVVRTVLFAPAPFSVGGGGGVLFLLGGILAAASQQAQDKILTGELLQECSLRDPSIPVRDRFVRRLEEAAPGLRVVPVDEIAPDDTLAGVKALAPGAYVIDFRTTLWELTRHYGHVPNPFTANYSVRARLVTSGSAEKVWEGTCEYVGTEGKSLADLRVFGCAGMSSLFEHGGAHCGDRLWTAFPESSLSLLSGQQAKRPAYPEPSGSSNR